MISEHLFTAMLLNGLDAERRITGWITPKSQVVETEYFNHLEGIPGESHMEALRQGLIIAKRSAKELEDEFVEGHEGDHVPWHYWTETRWDDCTGYLKSLIRAYAYLKGYARFVSYPSFVVECSPATWEKNRAVLLRVGKYIGFPVKHEALPENQFSRENFNHESFSSELDELELRHIVEEVLNEMFPSNSTIDSK